MPTQRQKLLVLYSATPSLNSRITAWSLYDGTGATSPTTGDSDEPPFPSAVAAMQAGWRVLQVNPVVPPYPGCEQRTSHLKFETLLEQIVEV